MKIDILLVSMDSLQSDAAVQKKEIIMCYPAFSRTIAMLCIIAFFALPVTAREKPAEYVNPSVSDETDPAYWLDLGGLFATYGNYSAAVEAYQKALELNPNLHQAYFDLGLAYMEMKQYDQALNHINKAIHLSPHYAHYYYGRAMVMLLSGQSVKADEDFKKAADMGDRDAKAYLQNR